MIDSSPSTSKLQAPDPVVCDRRGSQRTLSEFWQDGLTAFVFIRHLGCIFCREQVKDLRAHAAEIQRANVRLVIVTPATPQQNDVFARDLNLSFPILADPEHGAYRAYGFADGHANQLLSPRVVARSVQALAHGALPGKRIGNSRQLPGAAIVDRGGRIRYRKVAEDAADHLTTVELLAEAARIVVEDAALVTA